MKLPLLEVSIGIGGEDVIKEWLAPASKVIRESTGRDEGRMDGDEEPSMEVGTTFELEVEPPVVAVACVAEELGSSCG